MKASDHAQDIDDNYHSISVNAGAIQTNEDEIDTISLAT